MAHLELKKYSYEFTPANAKVNETANLFAVDAGEFVIGGGARMLVALDDTNAALSLGDGTDPNGYMDVTDPQNTGFEIADGPYLINAIGKLYTSADTVDAFYTQGDTDGTVGTCRFYVIKGRLEP